MALLDLIKGNLEATANPTAVGGINDTTSQISALNVAKTGKVARPTTGPRSSNLQEQIAAGQAALGVSELQQQAKIKAAELGQAEKAQTEQQGLQERQLDEASLQQHDTYANQSARILQELSQQGRALDFKKDAARVEQLGISTRLANDKYTTQLEQEGARSRLDTEIGFDEALQNAIWADEKDLLDHDMEFRTAINAKQNDFNEYMQNMGFDRALDIAEAEKKAANQRMIWEGISSLGSAGIGAYQTQKQGGFDSEYQNSQNTESGRYAQWKKENK